MRLVICGDFTQEIKDAVQKYYAFRGTACYFYDYTTLLDSLDDALKTVFDFNDIKVSEVNLLHIRKALYDCCKDILPKHADKTIYEITEQWINLNMHHITVIWGVPSPQDLSLFESHYRVLLQGEDKHVGHIFNKCHPLEVGFNDCAVSNIFDQVVDTIKHSPEEVATLIGAALHDKMMTVFNRVPDANESII
jgi:type IV secretory pathway VirB6-like protein